MHAACGARCRGTAARDEAAVYCATLRRSTTAAGMTRSPPVGAAASAPPDPRHHAPGRLHPLHPRNPLVSVTSHLRVRTDADRSVAATRPGVTANAIRTALPAACPVVPLEIGAMQRPSARPSTASTALDTSTSSGRPTPTRSRGWRTDAATTAVLHCEGGPAEFQQHDPGPTTAAGAGSVGGYVGHPAGRVPPSAPQRAAPPARARAPEPRWLSPHRSSTDCRTTGSGLDGTSPWCAPA
jgi:hypothetical protein